MKAFQGQEIVSNFISKSKTQNNTVLEKQVDVSAEASFKLVHAVREFYKDQQG